MIELVTRVWQNVSYSFGWNLGDMTGLKIECVGDGDGDGRGGGVMKFPLEMFLCTHTRC